MIHLIPGFALDRRVIEFLDLPRDRFRCADLIPISEGESLEGYALRMAEAMDYRPGDVVGGVSLGGMLALEIARRRGAARILLLASCTHPRAIRPAFRGLARLAGLAPEPFLHFLFGNSPRLLRRLGLHDEAGEKLLLDVMGKFPPSLLRRMPAMMLDWPGCEPAAPCTALHCEGDWLIRPPRHLPGLRLLPGRNHLLTLSHPEAARSFLMEAAAQAA